MNDRVPGLEPRQEAIPLTWEGDEQRSLTSTQREAAEHLWGLMQFFLDRAQTRSRFHKDRHSSDGIGDVLPAIDDKRRNQVLLIDGDRGSGKTALLITLLDAWNKAARGQVVSDGLERVADRNGRVVPIGLVDLRSLPNHTSLLVHISGLLRSLVEYLGIHRPGDVRPAISPSRGEASQASQDWQHFLTAVAATEQVIRRRSAELDPETFTEELHETEQDRLHVGERFGRLMDHLVAEFQVRRERETRRKDEAPVFVIAIDDADMNPARLGECFELFESFVHPRVVFVLTGWSKLLHATMQTQFLQELRRPLAHVRVSRKELPELNHLWHAQRLASQYYDKLIPPQQRCALPELPNEQRIEMLRTELERVVLGRGPNMYELFTRQPAFGELLPGHMRSLIDFGLELSRTLNRPGDLDSTIAFLARLKVRVAKSIKDEPGTAHDREVELDRLLPLPTTDAFVEKAPIYIDLGQLAHQGASYMTTLFADNHGFDSVSTARLVEFNVRLRDTDDIKHLSEVPRQERPLGSTLRAFCVFLEYVGELMSKSEGDVHFVPMAEQLVPLMSTRYVLRGHGWLFGKWPVPASAIGRGARVFEFERIWSKVRDAVVEEGYGQHDTLELLALNFLRTVVHVVREPFEASDPKSVLESTVDERVRLWDETIRQAFEPLEPSGFLATWMVTDFLQLAFPESGLPPDASKRLLEAWERHASHLLLSNEALLIQAEEQRRRRLGEQAEKHNSELAKWMEGVHRRFPDHPWTRKTTIDAASIVPRITAALAKVNCRAQPDAFWIPPNLAGYLTDRVRELLLEADPYELRRLCDDLERIFGDRGEPLRRLEHIWRLLKPRHPELLSWSGPFVVRSDFQVGVQPRDTITVEPIPAVISGVEYVISIGAIASVDESNVTRVVFRLIYDMSQDRTPPSDFAYAQWPLIDVHWRDAGTVNHWPAVGWRTHVDYEAMNERWARIVEGADLSPGSLGLLARRYVEAQILTFCHRGATQESTQDPTWPGLLEMALDAFESLLAPHLGRAVAFERWMLDLVWFAVPGSALAIEEAAAVLCAYLDVIATRKQGYFAWPHRRFPSDALANAHSDHPAQLFNDLRDYDAVRFWSRELRVRFQAKLPEQFEIPPERRELADTLARKIEAACAHSPTFRLSEDLLDALLHTFTNRLAAVDCAAGPKPGLVDLWRACNTRDGHTVQRTRGRYLVRGFYAYGDSSRHGRPKSMTFAAEYGIEYTLARGWIDSGYDRDNIALVVHAAAHDLVADTQSTGEPREPFRWPYAAAEQLGGSKYQPWRVVQWPARLDMYLQLESWHLDLDRRRDDGSDSLGDLLRNFIASTVYIYRNRQVYERMAGSWHEVIAAAHEALKVDKHKEVSDRRQAFKTWFDELPRLASPDVGLSEEHAAGILVWHYVDSGHDPRAQLRGRIFHVSGMDQKFEHELANHPAVRVAKASDDQLADVMNKLREEYALG